MLLNEVNGFYKKLLESKYFSEDLQNKLKYIHDEVEYKAFIEKELLPIAKKMGYDFAVDDILTYEQWKLKNLSEEELEKIVGGKNIMKDLSTAFLSALALAGGICALHSLHSVQATKPGTVAVAQPAKTPQADDIDKLMADKRVTIDRNILTQAKSGTNAALRYVAFCYEEGLEGVPMDATKSDTYKNQTKSIPDSAFIERLNASRSNKNTQIDKFKGMVPDDILANAKAVASTEGCRKMENRAALLSIQYACSFGYCDIPDGIDLERLCNVQYIWRNKNDAADCARIEKQLSDKAMENADKICAYMKKKRSDEAAAKKKEQEKEDKALAQAIAQSAQEAEDKATREEQMQQTLKKEIDKAANLVQLKSFDSKIENSGLSEEKQNILLVALNEKREAIEALEKASQEAKVAVEAAIDAAARLDDLNSNFESANIKNNPVLIEKDKQYLTNKIADKRTILIALKLEELAAKKEQLNKKLNEDIPTLTLIKSLPDTDQKELLRVNQLIQEKLSEILKLYLDTSNITSNTKEPTLIRRRITLLQQLNSLLITTTNQCFALKDIPNILPDVPATNKNSSGIKNFGNSCYFNSIIQQLYRHPEFRNHLNNLHNDAGITKLKQRNDIGFIVYYNILKIFEALDGHETGENIRNNVNAIRCVLFPDRPLTEQQDAEELLTSIFNSLEFETKPYGHGETYSITKATDGSPDENHSAPTSFTKLELEIVKPDKPTNSVDVQKCLNAYLTPELLTGDNQVRFNNTLKDATRQLFFSSVPDILMIQLKRFSFSSKTGKIQKITQKVNFNDIITVPVHQPDGTTIEKHYNLTGVVRHIGSSVNSGHYISYVLSSNGTNWIKLNDANPVTEYPNFNAMKNDVCDKKSQLTLENEAYILKYTCID